MGPEEVLGGPGCQGDASSLLPQKHTQFAITILGSQVVARHPRAFALASRASLEQFSPHCKVECRMKKEAGIKERLE